MPILNNSTQMSIVNVNNSGTYITISSVTFNGTEVFSGTSTGSPTISWGVSSYPTWSNSNGSELGGVVINVTAALNGATSIYWTHTGNGEYAVTSGSITSSGTYQITAGGWMEQGNGESIQFTFKNGGASGATITSFYVVLV